MNRKARQLLRALARAPRGPVAEIGCLRSASEVPTDGHSTLYLAQRCQRRGVAFRSFDLDSGAVDTANAVLRSAGLPETVTRTDGAAALTDMGPLALLYLDSSDVPADTLAQFHAAALRPGGVVVVDDAQPYGGHAFGKATDLVAWLREQRIPYRLVPTEPGYAMLVARLPEGKSANGQGILPQRPRLRVAIVVPYFHERKFGGAELWCREVALGLRARGHEVTVVTTNLTRHQDVLEPKARRREGAWGLDVRRHRVSVAAGLMARPLGFYPLAPGIAMDRALARADVVLVSGIEDPNSALGAVGARLRRKPVLVMPHTHMNLVRRMGPDRRVPLAFVESSASCYVQLNTDAERAFWRERLEERRILPAVGCGVHPLPQELRSGRAEARATLGLPEEQGVVLFLGRVSWAKGVLRAAEAVAGLPRDTHLYLVGFLEPHEAWLRGKKIRLPELLRERYPDRATLVGDVDERRKHLWLAACDLLVLPSHHESFGIAFLEAWQHGKPVIGWDEGGMPAVVGQEGFIVRSVEELRDAIATLLAKPDLARRMGDAGKAKVEERFTWDSVVERVERNLLEVLARESLRPPARETTDELREVFP